MRLEKLPEVLFKMVLAKWQFKGEIESFFFFDATAFYIFFFLNLENNKTLLLFLVQY